ncbi:MAG: Uma2 family endonuclease [Planctomycetes bacterium]|nr:Uma2 family endonuclease [Planctomycetota bacterium]
MSETTTPKLLTSDDLFAMPYSKRVDRWLFRGELRESKVTKRNPNHSGATANLSFLLGVWLKKQPKPRGKVFDGEAYFRIRKDPETNVGVDVALASAAQVALLKKKSTYVEGPPILAIEVLSPNDKQQDISDAIEEYLDCGVKQFWIVDPVAETVIVHRPNAEPLLYTRSQTLPGGDDLPGFSCPVAEIFEN